ncbi:MAG: PilZ domain-containing protein [Deltaproteobacteria bacterium]|jgi:Tfp pilus assembly protein PilZ|nr:PilZ domain-containing protein [Deltaproteobacteria bacterium]
MDLQEAMRKIFRIDISDNDDLSVKINDKTYELFDLGDNGIGLKLGTEDIFLDVGDELSVELTIKNKVLNLQGKVVHISPEGLVDRLCGIEFFNIDNEAQENLKEYIKSCREKIFEEE